jgi:hypothetical protein
MAEQLRGEVVAGGDPFLERKARAKAAAENRKTQREAAEAEVFTFKLLTERWAEAALKDRSAAYRSEAPRAVRACFPTFLARPAASISGEEAQHAVDAIVKTKPVMGRRSRDYARSMFNWALKRRLVPANPFLTVVIDARETTRDRVLSDAELVEAWHAAGDLGAPFGPFLRC